MPNTSPIIKGGIHTDNRGQLTFFNDFNMAEIKRMYSITNHKLPVSSSRSVRAWQGHKIEKKYFVVNQGSFLIAAVKIDHWGNPSPNLNPLTFILYATEPQILYIPPGYANGVKALQDDSILTVYSNMSWSESAADTYRFDASLWNVWAEEPNPPLERG